MALEDILQGISNGNKPDPSRNDKCEDDDDGGGDGSKQQTQKYASFYTHFEFAVSFMSF